VTSSFLLDPPSVTAGIGLPLSGLTSIPTQVEEELFGTFRLPVKGVPQKLLSVQSCT
jgi:hypothetical protein